MKVFLPKGQIVLKWSGILLLTILFWSALFSTSWGQSLFANTAKAADRQAENHVVSADEMTVSETVTPTVFIPNATVVITESTTFSVDINLAKDGVDIASTAFSILYNSECLTYQSYTVPGGFIESIMLQDAAESSDDISRRIDIAIWQESNISPLPDGEIVTLEFDYNFSACPYNEEAAYVFIFFIFDNNAVSFGDINGDDVDGVAYSGIYQLIYNTVPIANDDTGLNLISEDSGLLDVLANDFDADGDTLSIISSTDGLHGTTSISGDSIHYTRHDPSYNGTDTFTYFAYDGYSVSNSATVTVTTVADDPRGDCNASGSVTAADFVAIALEILDVDSSINWYEIYQLGYLGSPLGCDANASLAVDAPDIIRAVNIFFDNNEVRSAINANYGAASLAVANSLAVSAGEEINIPIILNSQDNAIAAAAVRLQFDSSQLDFDATDADGNGIPDAVQFQAPEGMLTLATYDANNGYLDIALIGTDSPMPTLSNGTIATISLKVSESAIATGTAIQLRQGSLGSVDGQDVAVSTINGNISIRQADGPFLNRQYFFPTIVR